MKNYAFMRNGYSTGLQQMAGTWEYSTLYRVEELAAAFSRSSANGLDHTAIGRLQNYLSRTNSGLALFQLGRRYTNPRGKSGLFNYLFVLVCTSCFARLAQIVSSLVLCLHLTSIIDENVILFALSLFPSRSVPQYSGSSISPTADLTTSGSIQATRTPLTHSPLQTCSGKCTISLVSAIPIDLDQYGLSPSPSSHGSCDNYSDRSGPCRSSGN